MAEQNQKRRKLDNSGVEYTVSLSNNTQQLNTIETNTNQIGHMIMALNTKIDTHISKTNENTAKLDFILQKLTNLETQMGHITTKNNQLFYQLEDVKRELSDLQIHMLHGQNMTIDTPYNNNIPDDGSFSYCA